MNTFGAWLNTKHPLIRCQATGGRVPSHKRQPQSCAKTIKNSPIHRRRPYGYISPSSLRFLALSRFCFLVALGTSPTSVFRAVTTLLGLSWKLVQRFGLGAVIALPSFSRLPAFCWFWTVVVNSEWLWQRDVTLCANSWKSCRASWRQPITAAMPT